MDKIDTTCESIRLRLIAAAVGLQQCTKTAANLVPIPGGDRVIAIGTPAQVRGLLAAASTASGSAAVDMDKLEALAKAADQGGGQHIYIHWRDSNNWQANEAWHNAASPEVFLHLLALARAGQTEWLHLDEPTHPNHPGHHEGHTCEAMGQMLADFESQRTTPEQVVARMQEKKAAPTQIAQLSKSINVQNSPNRAQGEPLIRCAAGRDGECSHAQCPQLRDREPAATGRHCPIDSEGGHHD